MIDTNNQNKKEKIVTIENYFEDYIVCNENDTLREAIDTREPFHMNGNSEWPEESMISFTLQMILPFFICGLGNLAAGQLLNYCQTLQVFREITELFILVPSLMGLKGNLEMTMASRLSTAANCGTTQQTGQLRLIVKGNLALIQCQATIVGFLASLVAIIVNTIKEKRIELDKVLVLSFGSVLTANIASVLLGTAMIFLIICCQRYAINPDNIATPIASSLGDITTVSLLSYSCVIIYNWTASINIWIVIGCVVVIVLIVPFTIRHAFNNKHTKDIVYSGWIPIIGAMIVSSFGGMILDHAIYKFEKTALLQPVINGVGGNLAAIQSSRISTYLHQRSKMGTLPHNENLYESPHTSLFGPSLHSKVCRILLLMSIPAHSLYYLIIVRLQAETIDSFLSVYLLAAILQVFILLLLARLIVYWLWSHSTDPDNWAIPVVSAFGDLLGTGLLACVLHATQYFSQVNRTR